MWDRCRFNQMARNSLTSKNKVVISTSSSSSNKALIINFMLKNALKLGLIADYSAKSSYVACEKAIHKWSKCVYRMREN